MNNKSLLTFICFILFLISNPLTAQKESSGAPYSWNYRLNEMNYLVLRASSINIIHGLHLTRDQVKELRALAKEMRSLELKIPNTRGHTYSGLVESRKTYVTLIDYLRKDKPIPDSLKNRFAKMRIREARIIKKSLIGAQRQSNKRRSGCMRCHAAPVNFPDDEVGDMETKSISESERKTIDRAHVQAIFGEEGIGKLWNLKSDVDRILTNGQRYMLKDFRCTFIPPEELENPTNIGQAFEKNKWIDYFTEIRGLSDNTWREYRKLYLIPVEDIIEATLPGIKKKHRKDMLKDVEQIIEKAREMDQIDFELKKDMLCSELQNTLNVDFLTGETNKEKEEREFIAAMFLLFPGSIEIYDNIIKKGNPMN